MSLAGQVALVTGAGRGIGRAIALAFAAEGTAVVAVARTLSEVEETAALVRASGQRALAVAADVSNWQSVQEMVNHAVQEFGSIHVLVNNAGVQGPIGPLVEDDVERWTQTVQVNLIGAFLCCKAVLPIMMRQCWGRIINLSGGGATGPRPNFSAYSASKAAVVRLTETLAEEVKSHNIQVNAIAPGAVNTRMLDEVLAAGEAAGGEWAVAQQRKAQGGTPAELAAELVLFLASDASGGLTGKLISAPHDDWRTWDAERITELVDSPWYTLRRIDPHTLSPLVERLR
jgi:3-oxoacyl-[acyl-carrier protein] reductase